jgi:predicted nucleic acid-binding protein
MAENNLIIVDASVMLKWFLAGEESQEAFELLERFEDDRIELMVPPHAFAEMMNILGMKSPSMALEAFSYLTMLGMIEAQLNLEITARAFEILKKHKKLSFYDACYHALALEYRGTFLTADKKYFDVAKGFGHISLLA